MHDGVLRGEARKKLGGQGTVVLPCWGVAESDIMSPWRTSTSGPTFVNFSQLRNVPFVLQKCQHRHKLWFEKYKTWLKIFKENQHTTYLVSFKNTDAHFISSSTFFLYILQWFALIAFDSIWNRLSSTHRPMRCSLEVNSIFMPWFANLIFYNQQSIMTHNQ